jgi:hypothetical protein
MPLAGVGAFGRLVPASGPAATTTIHTTVELDRHKVGQSITKHQQQRDRRNPPQKRGVGR